MTAFTVRRFHQSPDSGDPDCTCSLCGNAFVEEEMPIRLFGGINAPEEESWEMRYHPGCFEQIFITGNGRFVKRPDVMLEVEWGD